jgi:hypothetical protein
MALQPFVGPWPLFQFRNLFTQSVKPLGRGISPSQGRYLHTGQHKHRINAHKTDIHALSEVRSHDPSVRASEDSSCLRPRGHCGRHYSVLLHIKTGEDTFNFKRVLFIPCRKRVVKEIWRRFLGPSVLCFDDVKHTSYVPSYEVPPSLGGTCIPSLEG